MISTQERNRIALQNMGLVRRYINTHYNPIIPVEDQEQAATIGLLKAIERYDLSRGTLGNWAWWWIRQDSLREAGGIWWQARSLDAIGCYEEHNALEKREWFSYLGTISCDDAGPDALALQADLRQHLQLLPQHHQEALLMRYWLDLEYKQIGKRWGITPQAAQQRVYQAIDALRQQMGVTEYQPPKRYYRSEAKRAYHTRGCRTLNTLRQMSIQPGQSFLVADILQAAGMDDTPANRHTVCVELDRLIKRGLVERAGKDGRQVVYRSIIERIDEALK